MGSEKSSARRRISKNIVFSRVMHRLDIIDGLLNSIDARQLLYCTLNMIKTGISFKSIGEMAKEIIVRLISIKYEEK